MLQAVLRMACLLSYLSIIIVFISIIGFTFIVILVSFRNCFVLFVKTFALIYIIDLVILVQRKPILFHLVGSFSI